MVLLNIVSFESLTAHGFGTPPSAAIPFPLIDVTFRKAKSGDTLRELLTGSELARAIERLRNPIHGGKIEAAQKSGIDVTLLVEHIKLSPAERARRMSSLAQSAESVRGAAGKSRA